MREWWRRLTPEERREKVAARDAEKARTTARATYERNKPKRLAVMRAYRQRKPEAIVAAKRRWAERNPEKRRAQWALNNAIRDGRLERQLCEVCGAKAHAHHDNYSKPLEVRWLCPPHHAAEHRALREAA